MKTKQLRVTVATAVLLTGWVLAQAADAPDTKRVFNIQPQSTEKALTEFGLATGLQVLFVTKITAEHKSPAVVGELSTKEALDKLLANSGLKYEFINERTVRITTAALIERSRSENAAPVDMQVALVELAGGEEQGQEVKKADKAGSLRKSKEGAVEEMVVEDTSIKPFRDANVDIPRTINDHQPYYIFDSETIKRSGAYDLEDFLKQRLTMNTVAETNGQLSGYNQQGNTSSINLRGLGTDKTLILVNGRRMAGVYSTGWNERQPDLNGIPLSAIERIEVLPSSASGIYGGSALGGVVNVILKRDYSGGELRATYDNTWDTDSARRTVSGSYGMALEGGKTHFSINASWSDARNYMVQDRLDIFRENMALIVSRNPSFFYSNTSPWLGNLPNITPASSAATTLTLKNNGNPIVLNSRNTYIPAGTSPTTSAAELTAGLLSNAGNWNFDFPETTQPRSGLLRTFGVIPETKALMLNARRQMLPQLEVYADLSYTENRAVSVYNDGGILTVPAAAPTNPFTTDVYVQVPDASEAPIFTTSKNISVSIGAMAKLPASWTGVYDLTASENQYENFYYQNEFSAKSDALRTGELNPFVDSLLYPLNFQKFRNPQSSGRSGRLYAVNLRGSGPLPSLPWGAPSLTVGLEHRLAKTPSTSSTNYLPLRPLSSTLTVYRPRKSIADNAYLELSVPLVKTASMPLVHSLDLQLSGRTERYQVDTGTMSETIFYLRTPPTVGSYGGTTLNNQPYFSQASYSAQNHTLGLKYQPVRTLTLRVSRANAFLPPNPSELIKNPLQSSFTSSVNDRLTGQNGVLVYTLSGGNPDLKPQNATSTNAGLIWEPSWKPLSGLRLNAEYYRIEQFDAISTLDIQQIVDQESTYPDRVIRDSSGRITLVDTSSLNLYRRNTAGWDLSVDYSLKTGVGRFNLHAVESIIQRLETQYAQTLPLYDAVDFPSEGGAGKYKTNATVSWEGRQWTAGWTVRYFSSYKQYGALGGPDATRKLATNPSATLFTAYTRIQGGDTIPSQTYHDLFLSYAFDGHGAGVSSGMSSPVSGLLQGLTAQLGVRNVFNTVPPFDGWYDIYLSPYGDKRLRTYWFNLAKQFGR